MGHKPLTNPSVGTMWDGAGSASRHPSSRPDRYFRRLFAVSQGAHVPGAGHDLGLRMSGGAVCGTGGGEVVFQRAAAIDGGSVEARGQSPRLR